MLAAAFGQSGEVRVQSLEEWLKTGEIRSVRGLQDVRESVIYLNGVEPSETEQLEWLTASTIKTSGSNVRISRTKQRIKALERKSDAAARSAVEQALVDIKHSLPIRTSPAERAEASIRQFMSEVRRRESGEDAQEWRQFGSVSLRPSLPIHALLKEMILEFGAGRLLELDQYEFYSYATDPNRYELTLPIAIGPLLESYAESELALSQLSLPELDESDPSSLAWLQRVLDLNLDGQIGKVILHVHRYGPTWFHFNLAVYAANGSLREWSTSVIDARRTFFKQAKVPDWVGKIPPLEQPDGRSSPLRFRSYVEGDFPDPQQRLAEIALEPQSFDTADALDHLAAWSGKSVAANLPDNWFYGIDSYFSGIRYDLASHLTYLLQTRTIEIEESDSLIRIRPYAVVSDENIRLPRKAIRSLVRSVQAEGRATFSQNARFSVLAKNSLATPLPGAISSSVQDCDEGLGPLAFNVFLHCRLLAGSLFNAGARLESGRYTWQSLSAEQRRHALNWLKQTPMPLDLEPAVDELSEVQRAPTMAVDRASSIEFLIESGTASSYAVAPIAGHQYLHRGTHFMDLAALGRVIGNWFGQSMIDESQIDGLQLFVGPREQAKLSLLLDGRHAKSETVYGRKPTEMDTVAVKDLPEAIRSQIWEEIERWRRFRARFTELNVGR